MIGFFDSGVGGLSILKNALEILPNHDYAYFGDEAYCPWGEKPKEFIIERSRLITIKLISLGTKAIVVACNTATVNAISTLRAEFPSIPFIGVEPGVKPATTLTESGKIAVLATKATSLGDRFLQLVNLFAQDKDIIMIPSSGLVELVEQGKCEGEEVEERLSEILLPYMKTGFDQLVLGCTHYPFLAGALRKILPSKVNIIDTGPPVAKQLARVIMQNNILEGNGRVSLWTSGDPGKFCELASKLLGIEINKIERF